MKSLVVIFTLCFIPRFTNGQGFMEEQDDKVNNDDIVILGDKMIGVGNVAPSDAIFRGETEEMMDEPGSDDTKNQKESKESSLEANTEASETEVDEQSVLSPGNEEESKKIFEETMQRFASEMAAGDTADLIGQNQHIVQDTMYNDLGRRFVPQYKYTGAFKTAAAEHNDDLKPEKAPPELVLVVAKESALLGPDKDMDLGNDIDRKKILRSGDYWNGVWKEEVNLKNTLRSGTEKKVLGSIKAKVKPGSDFYKVVSRMKKISPRLLYIINKKQV